MIRWTKLLLTLVAAGLALATATGTADEEDTVTFSNVALGEEFAFIVDGKRDGEQVDDAAYRETIPATSTTSSVTVSIGNMQQNAWNEITVFQKGRMVGIHTPSWTDDGGNRYPVELKEESAIDLDVWLVKDRRVTTSGYNRASWAAARATEIWTNERMGVKLGTLTVHADIPVDENLQNLLKFSCTSTGCKEGEDLKRLVGHVPGRVNVYYVEEVNFGDGWATTNGVWCHDDMLVLGREARSDLLSHEFGHSLQLNHVSGAAFNEKNVMWDLSVSRRYYTEGQLMRSYAVENSSIVRTYKLVSGAHDCNESKMCPGVEFRIWDDD